MKARWILLLGLGLLAGCATEQPTNTVPAQIRESRPAIATSPPGAPEFWPASAPAIHAKSAVMIDARSGRVLYQKYADTPQQVASTQKLVTALLVVERGDLDGQLVVASADTQVEPTKVGLRAGERYTRRQILSGMLVKSENDCAHALGRDHSGSIEAFAVEMNRKAAECGAQNSHFVNPNGLPAAQHSTARDMARIAFRAYREPVLRELMDSQTYTFVFPSGRSTRLENTNKLLWHSPIFTGMKTGFTNAAGKCLVASASAGGREVILVQLGSHAKWIFDDADVLLRWGLQQGSLPNFGPVPSL
ncbi:N/A [soil metagenome]